MKKIIIGAVLVAMLGWAIFNFFSSENNDSEEAGVGLDQGNIAPDFELTTLNGETVKLSDYRGRKVLLNFWATWCPPCREEMPDMQKLYDEYDDVEVLAVNLTSTEATVDDVSGFVNEMGLSFPILMDEEADVSTKYSVQAYPTSYMIDTEGKVHIVALGPMNYEQMVEKVEEMD